MKKQTIASLTQLVQSLETRIDLLEKDRDNLMNGLGEAEEELYAPRPTFRGRLSAVRDKASGAGFKVMKTLSRVRVQAPVILQ